MRSLTLEQAAAHFANLGGPLRYYLGEAVHDGLEELLKAAVDWTSGPLTPEDLAALGHPYSRRRAPKRDPRRINRQSGALAAGWQARGPIRRRDAIEGLIWNGSRKAAEMEAGLVKGKPLMWPREPHLGALQEAEPLILARVERAIDAALEP